uniref:WD repeat domain-containing protein 83 n=1 Tax=Ditylenchus dipsaci TaxID=166011 RepID=A0A915EJN0_9BILA
MKATNLPTNLLRSFNCEQSAVRSVRFNVDGNYCITGGSDKSVKLWNPFRPVMLKSYAGCGGEVLDAQGSSDNSMILAGGRDKAPTIFDVETGKMLKRWKDHGGAINAVAFNEDSSVALSASQDGTVNCYDVRSRGPPIQKLDEATDSVLCIDVNAFEIVTGSADGSLRLYDIREGRLFVDFMGDSVTDVHLTADNQCILTSTMKHPIRLIEKVNGQLLADYSGHKNTEFQIEAEMLSSNNELVSGSEEGLVYIWDLVSTKIIAKLPHPGTKYVHSVTTHPSNQSLLSVAGENLYVWQCEEEL